MMSPVPNIYGEELMAHLIAGLERDDDPHSPKFVGSDVDDALDREDQLGMEGRLMLLGGAPASLSSSSSDEEDFEELESQRRLEAQEKLHEKARGNDNECRQDSRRRLVQVEVDVMGRRQLEENVRRRAEIKEPVSQREIRTLQDGREGTSRRAKSSLKDDRHGDRLDRKAERGREMNSFLGKIPPVRMTSYRDCCLRDIIVVYTNSIRAELKDMLKILMSLKTRRSSARIDDFRMEFARWWSYTSKYLLAVVGVIQMDILRFARQFISDKKSLKAFRAFDESVAAQMEDIRDFAAEVDNVFVRFQAHWNETEKSIKIIPLLYRKVDKLVPPLIALLDRLDHCLMSSVFVKQPSAAKALVQLHRDAVRSIATNSGLGWAVLVTLTRWMPSKTAKHRFIAANVRGVKKLSFLRSSIYVRDTHYALLETFRERAYELKY